MKLLIIKVFVFVIRLFYAPMKLRKTQNKIVFLSRQSNVISEDMKMLSEGIKKLSPETKLVYGLRELKTESSLTPSYILGVFKDMWELSTAKVCITDTYSIPVSCLRHKKSLKSIQIWHAMGAIKKFSLQSVGMAQGRDTSVSRAMHMHENYDYVLAPSAQTGRIYCEAFGCTSDKIKILNLPRVDVILNGENRRDEFLELNPQYKGKKLVAYIPTFRDNDELYAERLTEAFRSCDEAVLIVSAHPLSKTAQSGNYQLNGKFSSLDLMKLSDAVVSDYSACAIEASLLEKPLYFYIPDYDIYKNERGLNTDMKKELPFCCFETGENLKKAIASSDYDYNALRCFADKYVEDKHINNNEQLSKFVCSLLE